MSAGSVSTSATSPGSSARSRASASLNGTTRASPVTDRGRPAISGTTSSPSNTTSVVSSSPWYLPSKTTTTSRPVIARATRITSVFAWVADSVNCHLGRP